MRKSSQLLVTYVCILATLFALSYARAEPAAERQLAKQILDATGVKGGLIAHIGCGDGRLTAALRANDSYLVHGLDADAENVERAREYIRSLNLYGEVSLEVFAGNRLPYTDNLVNLVVSEDPGQVPMEEVMRVLCPNGTAYIKRDGEWMKTIKPRPEEIDDWTHYLHDATNNAVAEDSVVGPPHHVQWIGGPKWARSHDHLASVSALVSSGGRVFYIVDEGPIASVALPSDWFLVARDAFNGVVLWKRPVGPWEGQLRPFRSGPSELTRRLVAVGDRVYVTLGYGKPVSALDAVTGETVRTYEGTEGAIEIVYLDSVILVVVGNRDAEKMAEAAIRRGATPPAREKRLLAIKADTGGLLWQKSDAHTSEMMPMTLCAVGGNVFFQSISEVICLGAMSGDEVWSTARPISTDRWAWSTPTLVAQDGVVISADRASSAVVPEEFAIEGEVEPGQVKWTPHRKGGDAPEGEMMAFSAKTGELLWTAGCREVYNGPVDVLVTDGLVWSGNQVRSREPGITVGRDLSTGEIKSQRPSDDAFFKVGMGHHRCYRNKATSNYIVLGRSGVEFIDLASGRGIANHWIRGTCQYGVMPCNGLLYVPPHSCACYITSKLNSFNALAPRRTTESAKQEEGSRLRQGPAYDQIRGLASEAADVQDWPTYRHDPGRSGSIGSTVPTALESKWQREFGGKLTSPVAADGKIFIASIDAHTVYALNPDSGGVVWSYTVGGRVDSPPTIYRGLALFGCADGRVYCLRASDGELVWSFRAAPEDRRVVAYGQLESVWPVHGSLLIQDGIVYFVAGRSSFLDDGMYLYRLDPKTGKKLTERRIYSRDPRTGEQPKGVIRGTSMPGFGALPDVLSSDGASIYMRHVVFNRKGVPQTSSVPHLFSSVGFLDSSWWHRTYWIIGTEMGCGYGGWPKVGNRVPAGRLLVCSDSTVYGFGRDSYNTLGSHVGLGDTHYRLFSADREPVKIDASALTPEEKRRRQRRGQLPDHDINYHWFQQVPVLARAMVLADNTLFLAGPPDTGDEIQALASLDGTKGGILCAVSAADGEKLAEYELDSIPAFDGMIAVSGRLYMSTQDGRLLCFAGK